MLRTLIQKQTLTLTGNPSLGITRPLGILQVSSFNKTWALHCTSPIVIVIFIHVFTVFRWLCCYIREKNYLLYNYSEHVLNHWDINAKKMCLSPKLVTWIDINSKTSVNIHAVKLQCLLVLEVILYLRFQREWPWHQGGSRNGSCKGPFFHPCE